MEAPPRVLLMIDDASIGGGQQHLLWLAQRMNKEIVNVAVACAPEGYLVEELRKCGIRHFPVEIGNTLSIRSLRRCRAVLREFSPALLHTHGGTAGFAGRVASVGMPGLRRVHTYHGIHYLHSPNPFTRIAFTLVDRMLLPMTAATICVARADYELGVRKHIVDPARSAVILNGIDLGRFRTLSTRHATGHFVVGTIGRLHPQKGHKYLFEAAVKVLVACPDTLFRIVGDGELRQALEEQVRSLRIERHVQFLGNQTDIPELLSSMDLFVLPSLWEGLPLVLLEAMAAEKPIVATAVDGVQEVLKDGVNACLVPPGDSGLLAKALIGVQKDQTLSSRIAQRGRQDVEKAFSVDRMVRETEDLYRKVLS